MKNNRILYFWMCILLAAIIISLSCTASSIFEQVGYYKKSNGNTNIRVYSIYIKGFEDNESIWEKTKSYAKSQMYSQGGSTTVLFFNDKMNTPDVTLTGLGFADSYEKYCIAGYWIFPNGKEEFKKYPFKK